MVLLISCRVCPGISAKQFIDQAIVNGGRVLVHCNGEPLNKVSHLERNIILHRGNQSIASIRSHVCHATLSTFMGRCSTHGSKPTLLHITQWWVLDTNKGIYYKFGHSSLIQQLLIVCCINQEYEAIYRANVAVAAYPTVERTASRRKREDDDDADDDQRYALFTRR
jgi:hypothetical protein